MTEDERMINDTWPLIRETVGRYKAILDQTNVGSVLRGRPLSQQLAFWLTLAQLDELIDSDVVEIARREKREPRGLHAGSDGGW